MHVDQIQKHISIIDKGEDAAQRQAIHALRENEAQDWNAIPQSLMNQLVAALHRVLTNGSKPPVVHKEIAIILSRLGPRSKSAIPMLIQLLHEGIPDCVRDAAALALGRLGKDARDAVDPLVALSANPTNAAFCAVRALSEIGCADHRVRSALMKLWQSPAHSQNGALQVAVAMCRLKIDAKGLLGFLTNYLVKSQDDTIRKTAAEALGWCTKSDLDVVPALLGAALSDKDEEVREVAQAALTQMKLTNEKAIQVCASQLKDSLYAEAALRKSGQPAVPALVEALGSSDSEIRVKAARILATFGELAVDAVPALTAALRDRNGEIRLAAAKGLWNVTKNPDEAVPVLAKLLEDDRASDFEDSEERRRYLQTVIEALWRIGPPAVAAVPALVAKTKDKNRLVGQSAQNALSKIAPTPIK